MATLALAVVDFGPTYLVCATYTLARCVKH